MILLPLHLLVLIFFGPFAVLGSLAVAAEMSFPGLLRPASRPAPRPVTRPRPARWAVA